MTEEEVVNVRGEISERGGAENGDDDQHKIKGEYCNDVAHAMENEQVVINGDVGGKIDSDASGEFVGGSDAVAADGDSGASDLVAAVDDNVAGAGAGAASEGLDLVHKVDGDGEGLGESQVTVLEVVEAECECEVVNKENDCADASVVCNGSAEEEIRETEISNGSVSVDVDVGVENAVRESESECADGQNGSGSVIVLDVSGDEKDVTTTTVVEEGVTDVNKIHDLKIESVVVGAEDVQNGVADRELSECAVDNEIHGDVNGISVTDVNKVHHHEFESVVGAADIQNGVENEIPDDVNGVQECENIAGSAEVFGYEKDVTTTTVVEEGVTDVNKIHDHEIKSVVVGAEDVQNGMADRELSECAVENEIHGDVNGVSVTDVNKIHNHKFESVVGAADVQNSVEIEVRDDVNGGQECENIAGAAEVLVDEKDVSTTTVVEEGVTDVNKIHDPEFESVVVGVEDVQNGVADREVSECAVENEFHGDVNGVSVTDVNEVHDHKFESVVGAADVQNGVANEICDDVNGVQECENIAGAAEVLGDEKDDVTVVEGVADVNKSHGEFESVAVQNGVADTELSECTDKNEISVAVVDGVSEECVDKDAQNSSGEKAQIESVDSGGGDEKDGRTVVQERSESVSDTVVDISLECENIVGAAASDEKDIVTKESHDGEFKSVVVADDQNGLADTELSECAEKNEISVDVDGVSADSDVKECADEDDHNGLEKAQIESVTDTDVDQSIVGADVQNGLADAEENEIPTEGEPGSKLEMSEEESGHELVPEGENLSALNSTDMTGDGNVVSDTKDSAVEREGEPSADMFDMKNNGVESEAEPSNIAVESETEPSVEGELSVEVEGGKHGDGDSRPAQEGSTTDTLDGQNMGAEVVKRPFYYLIRFPRYDDDENMKEQIKNALHQVEEKTKIRDAIRVESQTKKASCKECGQDVRAAISAERAARDLLKSKRQEMDSVQSTMNRLNNAISVGDIDGKIRNMEHMIQHETLPLKEEKQLIRQIKQLKQNREELSSNMGKQDQSQQCLDHKDSVEEHFKRLQLLKKEVELLRNNVLKTEVATKAARKKYDDESNKLSELLARFKAADDIRQEAYAKLQALRKQLHEKSKYFWEYKNAAKKGQELAAEGKREELQYFCVDQVERIMELWNKNDEFRRDYVRCNTRSTLRRLQTVDGRSLGPDEEPPVIPNALTERAPKNNSLISQSTPEQEKKSTSTESVNIKDEPVSKVVVQRTDKSQTTKAKKPAKPAPLEKSLVAVSRWGDEPEDTIEEPVRTKEEEELILKAEKARKEEEAAKLKEKRRLEEIEKAKEAMQRKKRNAEKAQQRAALKAQKEAEQKEKEREKKARKKERKAASTDTADNTEQESALGSETLASTEENDQSEKPVEITKRPQKPSQFMRQTKAKSLPLPLRNRGKRRIQSWMWVLIALLVVVALFYMGNNSSLRSLLQRFGF